MTKKSYYELETGYEFPPASYELERSMVSAYLQAVGREGDDALVVHGQTCSR